MVSDQINRSLSSLYADPLIEQHKEAMACRDLETVLGVGVLLFRQLSAKHKEWFTKAESKAIPYDVDTAQALADEFKEWKTATEFWLTVIAHFEGQDYEVDHAGRIREYYEQIKLSNLNVREAYAVREKVKKDGGIPWDSFYQEMKQAIP